MKAIILCSIYFLVTLVTATKKYRPFVDLSKSHGRTKRSSAPTGIGSSHLTTNNIVPIASYNQIGADNVYTNIISSSNYQSNLIPAPVQVDISVFLTHLLELDQIGQYLTVNVYFLLQWKDHRLTWDPNDPNYLNITDLIVPPESVWTPDLTLYNTANGGQHYFGQSVSEQHRLTVSHTGDISWKPQMEYTMSCAMKMGKFPFDTQICHMKMGSWAYPKAYLDWSFGSSIESSTDNTTADMFTQEFNYNREWELYHAPIAYNQRYAEDGSGTINPDLKMYFILVRNYDKYMFNVISVSILFVILCFLSFLLPIHDGDRLNLSFSILISISVYQIMISDLTPNGTDETPALSMFLMLMIIFINLAILVTVFARRLKVSERSVRPGEITRKIWIDWIGFLMLVRTSKKYARWQERVKENRPPSRENQVDNVTDESTVNASKYETDGSLDKQEPKQEIT